MKKITPTQMRYIAQGISAAVSVLAVAAWAGSSPWHLTGLSAYKIFPLLGLLAFSLMWAHAQS